MDYWTGLCFLNILNVVFTTPDMFYTVHMDKKAFDDAQGSCTLDKGFLTNMENQGEIAKILQAIENKGEITMTSFWIGLRKERRDCVQPNLPLMGFSWIIGNSTEFDASKWKSEPEGTCTSALCALLSVTYKGTTIESWQFVSSGCKHAYPFVCKREGQREQWPCPYPTMHGKADIMQKHHDPYTLQVTCNSGPSFTLTCSQSTREWRLQNQPDTDISGLCMECNQGYRKDKQGFCVDVDECKEPHVCKHKCMNTLGSYKCKCSDTHGMDGKDSDNCSKAGNVDHSHESTHGFQDNPTPSTMDDGRHSPSVRPESTTEDSVHLEGNTGDLSNIIIPVIIALLIFVVLVVITVAIVKCCLIRRSKKRAKKRAEVSKESMALNGSDSMEKVSDREVI
ncbi:C-type lectin domain family 14 member A [Astyanax mexicanus]|uniref:C-type lectin domain family 14 member A n=1 Tax=Astyanax mexicanus TaxID=7994 RepID=A0A8T2LH16_ASTMX|nr:C-type lectin domain family 14 member A [Astyanax mexicanus]